MSYDDANWWVSNPLILLIVGAVSSGILIPSFTRKWQDHQTELNQKIELVDKLSESVTKIVIACKYGTTRNDMEKDIREYHTGCSYITSRIEAYFYPSNDQIAKKWWKYDIVLRELYELPGTSGETREKRITAIETLVEELQNEMFEMDQRGKSRIDWETLKSEQGNDENLKYSKEWNKLTDTIFDMKHNLMRDIMNSDIPIFNKGISIKKTKQKFYRLFSQMKKNKAQIITR
jgi:hypothetical protein